MSGILDYGATCSFLEEGVGIPTGCPSGEAVGMAHRYIKQAMHAARNSKLDLVYILRSTSSSQLTTMVSSMNGYHKEEELNELVRLCERHNTPCAVNEATASAVLQQICNPY